MDVFGVKHPCLTFQQPLVAEIYAKQATHHLLLFFKKINGPHFFCLIKNKKINKQT